MRLPLFTIFNEFVNKVGTVIFIFDYTSFVFRFNLTTVALQMNGYDQLVGNLKLEIKTELVKNKEPTKRSFFQIIGHNIIKRVINKSVWCRN